MTLCILCDKEFKGKAEFKKHLQSCEEQTKTKEATTMAKARGKKIATLDDHGNLTVKFRFKAG